MCHMSRYCDYCEVADNCESSLSPRAQNIVHLVALSTGLWLKVCISMPRKHDDSGIPLSFGTRSTLRGWNLYAISSGIPRQQAHEVSRHTVRNWYRYLARDPPSYDSGTPLSEADAKTMMDKIEARSKWLKANGKASKVLGKHQRAILARAKFKADDDSGIPRQEALMRAGCIN